MTTTAEDAVLHAMINKNTSSLDAALACLSDIPDRVVQMSQNTHILGDFAAIATAAVQLRRDALMKIATANAMSPNFLMERAIYAGSGANDVIKHLIDMKADVALAVTQAIDYGNADALRTLAPAPTEAMFDAAAENKEVTSVLVSLALQPVVKPAVKPDAVPAEFVRKRPADVQVGDYLDAMIETGHWVSAKVVAAVEKTVIVRYMGRPQSLNEIFSRESTRLAVAGTKCITALQSVEVGQIVSIIGRDVWCPAVVSAISGKQVLLGDGRGCVTISNLREYGYRG
jgi:hypothetical protein